MTSASSQTSQRLTWTRASPTVWDISACVSFSLNHTKTVPSQSLDHHWNIPTIGRRKLQFQSHIPHRQPLLLQVCRSVWVAQALSAFEIKISACCLHPHDALATAVRASVRPLLAYGKPREGGGSSACHPQELLQRNQEEQDKDLCGWKRSRIYRRSGSERIRRWMDDRVSTGGSTDLRTTLLPNPCFYDLLQVAGSSLGGPIHFEQLFGLSPSTRCHDCSELLLQEFAQVHLVSKCCNIAVA